MATVLITGASGYLGSRLVELALQRGFEVRVLGSPPRNSGTIQTFRWRLGDEPPQEALSGATAVFHLGHSVASDSAAKNVTENINFSGAEQLAVAALTADVPRFVFASTISARSNSLNAYGRVKFAIEERLRGMSSRKNTFLCARIGLVYGGKERGLYGLMSKLVRLTPILPMIGMNRMVQPIHVDEVCAGLLALGLDPLPIGDCAPPQPFILAGPRPMLFADWLRLLRRAHTRKSILLIPIPLRLALIACNLTKFVPFVPVVDRERVLGLAGTEPVASAADLAALKITVIDPALRLRSLRSERRQVIREARAILSYVAGHEVSSTAEIARLVRGIDRLSTGSLGLPNFVTRHASLLLFFDPHSASPSHRLAQRIFLASMVAESTEAYRSPARPSLLRVSGQIVVECMVFPFRLVLGRLYA